MVETANQLAIYDAKAYLAWIGLKNEVAGRQRRQLEFCPAAKPISR